MEPEASPPTSYFALLKNITDFTTYTDANSSSTYVNPIIGVPLSCRGTCQQADANDDNTLINSTNPTLHWLVGTNTNLMDNFNLLTQNPRPYTDSPYTNTNIPTTGMMIRNSQLASSGIWGGPDAGFSFYSYAQYNFINRPILGTQTQTNDTVDAQLNPGNYFPYAGNSMVGFRCLSKIKEDPEGKFIPE
jgi:hypothetical protein